MENFQQDSNSVPKKLQAENRDKEIEIDNNLIVAPPGNDPDDSPDDTQEKYPVGDFEYQCVDILVQSCVAVFPGSKIPRTDEEKKKWAVEIERMKRLDGRKEADIVEALTFATTDGFWKSNIRSAKKFREKFETLIIQGRQRNGVQAGAGRGFNTFMKNNYDIESIERSFMANGNGSGQ